MCFVWEALCLPLVFLLSFKEEYSMNSFLTEVDEIKIFILYLLDKIGYPLDYPSISQIMMQDGIVRFIDFAECFFALV